MSDEPTTPPDDKCLERLRSMNTREFEREFYGRWEEQVADKLRLEPCIFDGDLRIDKRRNAGQSWDIVKDAVFDEWVGSLAERKDEE